MSALLATFRRTAAVAAAALLSAHAAHAGPVSFSDFAAGSENLHFAIAAGSGHAALAEDVGAGGIAATINGLASFVTFCVDLYQSIGFGQTYSDFTPVDANLHAFANPKAALDIGKLYYADANALATGTAQQRAIKQAAFQVAIWEIASEAGGRYDVFGGNLVFSNPSNSADSAAALTQANQWLAALASVDRSFALVVLESPSYQDQIYATGLASEPPAASLLASALLGLAWFSRRSRRGPTWHGPALG